MASTSGHQVQASSFRSHGGVGGCRPPQPSSVGVDEFIFRPTAQDASNRRIWCSVKNRRPLPLARRPLTTADLLHIHLIWSPNVKARPPTPCLCNALRQASRAVSRLYDEELRGVGLRTTQYSLLRVIARAGQVRQGDLSELTSLDETTLTRNLRPLVDAAGSPSAAGTTAARSWSRSPGPGPPSWRRPARRGSGRRCGCRHYCRRENGSASWRSSRRSRRLTAGA